MMSPILTVRQPSREHWTGSNGHRLFLAEKKAAAQSPRGTILLVHGSSAGSQAFDLDIPGDPDASIMDWFACRGYDIWRLDFLGYGRSDRPEGHFATVAEGVDDLLAACSYITGRNGGDVPMLLGYSSGALRAALFAERHPDFVKRLALEALVYTGKDSPTLAKRAQKLEVWKSSARRPLDHAHLLSTMTRDHAETTMESRKQPHIDAILAIEDSVPNGTYVDMCENLPVCDPARIRMPTAILRGQYDGIAAFDDLLDFFRLLPNADKEFVVMPGIAHTAGTAKNYLRFYDAAYTFFSRPEPVFKG